MQASEFQPLVGTHAPASKLRWSYWRFCPFAGEFWERHFGTDMLVGSWMLLASTVLWVIWEVVELLQEDVHRAYVRQAHYVIITSGLLFSLGAFFFVIMSYPEELEKQMERVMEIGGNPEKYTWLERYVTGTDMLLATWFFNLASLPLLVFGFFEIIEHPALAVGYVFLVGCLFMLATTSIWVVGAMPENVVANGGQGTTYCYDAFIVPILHCCCVKTGSKEDTTMREHVGSDLLFGMWLFTVMAAVFMPLAILEGIDYQDTLAYLDLAMAAFFFLGMCLLTYASYPGNIHSHLFWDIVTCYGHLCCRPTFQHYEAMDSNDASTGLLSTDDDEEKV